MILALALLHDHDAAGEERQRTRSYIKKEDKLYSTDMGLMHILLYCMVIISSDAYSLINVSGT